MSNIKQFQTTISDKQCLAKRYSHTVNIIYKIIEEKYVPTDKEFDQFITAYTARRSRSCATRYYYSKHIRFVKYMFKDRFISRTNFNKLVSCYKTENFKLECVWLKVMMDQQYKFDEEENLILNQNKVLKKRYELYNPNYVLTEDDIKFWSNRITNISELYDTVVPNLPNPCSEELLICLLKKYEPWNRSKFFDNHDETLFFQKKYLFTEKFFEWFLNLKLPMLVDMIVFHENGAPITPKHIEILDRREYYLAILYSMTHGVNVNLQIREKILNEHDGHSISKKFKIPENLMINGAFSKNLFDKHYPLKGGNSLETLQFLCYNGKIDEAAAYVAKNSINLGKEHLEGALKTDNPKFIKFIMDYKVVPDKEVVLNVKTMSKETVNLLLSYGLQIDKDVFKWLCRLRFELQDIQNLNLDFEDVYKGCFDGMFWTKNYTDYLDNYPICRLRKMCLVSSVNDVMKYAEEHNLKFDGYCVVNSFDNNMRLYNHFVEKLGYKPPLQCLRTYILTNHMDILEMYEVDNLREVY